MSLENIICLKSQEFALDHEFCNLIKLAYSLEQIFGRFFETYQSFLNRLLIYFV